MMTANAVVIYIRLAATVCRVGPAVKPAGGTAMTEFWVMHESGVWWLGYGETRFPMACTSASMGKSLGTKLNLTKCPPSTLQVLLNGNYIYFNKTGI